MGQAFCQMSFDHWSHVPGDPTDTSIQLRPLEPATGQSLARDLVLKTRRRKGLSDSIAVSKYLEDEVSFEGQLRSSHCHVFAPFVFPNIPKLSLRNSVLFSLLC